MQFQNLAIALYARLSQDRSGLSENVDIQLREGEEYVQDNDGTVSLRFSDDDFSASVYTTKPRPDYIRLVAAVKRNEVEVIIVTEMQRLYRQMEELLDLIKLARTTRLRGIWTTDGIGYNLETAEGIHSAIEAVNNAMYESAKNSRRGKRKKKTRAEQGRYLGGKRAYGYEGVKKDEDGNITNRGRINVALVPHEVKVIKTCVARIIVGERISTIIRDLNEQGIPAPEGGQWSFGNIKKCLTKKRYVIFDDNDPERRGILEHNGIEYRAVWEGIITREQHALMLARFAATASGRKTQKHAFRRTYLLTGLLECGNCGCGMYGSSTPYARRISVKSYRCQRKDIHAQITGCGKIFRSAEPLEDFVTEAVLAKLDVPEIHQALTGQEEDNGVSELVETLAQRRQHRINLLAEYGRGEHSKADFAIMLAAVDEAIELAEAQVAEHLGSQTGAQLPTDQALRELWADASTDWRAEVIGLLVERIVILPGRPGSHRYKQWCFQPAHVRIEWRQLTKEVKLSIAAMITTQRKAVSALVTQDSLVSVQRRATLAAKTAASAHRLLPV